MIGGTLRIKYTGAQASCILEADTTADTLSSKIGAAGSESLDSNFGTGGVIDLTAAATNTLSKLQTVINGYSDYSGEVYQSLLDIDASLVLDAKIQAKDVWAYLVFELSSVLDTVNSLITWELAQDMQNYQDDEQTTVERLINAASQTANRITGRLLKARDYTKILNGTGNAKINLGEYPVNSLSNLYKDSDRVFGSDTEVSSSDYGLFEESGIVQLYDGTFPIGIKTVKAIFNAGLGYNGAAIPEDLQFAVLETVVWNAKRFGSKKIGDRSVNADGVNVTFEITIPMNAQRVFEAYARRFV